MSKEYLELPRLLVTRNGIPCSDQNAALEEFKQRCLGGNSLASDIGMDFGGALRVLKAGRAVTRSGWNGKGRFVYYVPADSYPAKTAIAKKYFAESSGNNEAYPPMVPYGAYLAMKTAQGNVVPWLASQTDVLAEDWEIA